MLLRWGLIALAATGLTMIEPREVAAEAQGKTFSVSVVTFGYYISGQLTFNDDGTFYYEDSATIIAGTYTETVDSVSGASVLTAGGGGEDYQVTFSAQTLDTISSETTQSTLIMGFGFSDAGLGYFFSGSSITEPTTADPADPNATSPDPEVPDAETDSGAAPKAERRRSGRRR